MIVLLKFLSCCLALAEILSVKEVSGRKLYYVHYIDCEYIWACLRCCCCCCCKPLRWLNWLLTVNKRLDEWVTADRLDMKKLQFPKKEAKTPTKNGLPGSRPSSPEREVVSGYTFRIANILNFVFLFSLWLLSTLHLVRFVNKMSYILYVKCWLSRNSTTLGIQSHFW